MNTQDMDRLVSEYHAHIQNAERCSADQAFKEAALNYQQAAEICRRLAERTTGAEAQEWLKKQAACERRMWKHWAELYKKVRESEPDTGSADDSACGTQAEEPGKTAAEQKDADACYWSGLCCYHGHGMEQDYTQAVEWFRKAIELGHKYAYYWLGICYYHGQGVEQDYTQAVQWFRKGAELGDEEARYWLGVCYYHGHGVEQDYAQAAQLYQKAAEQGHKDAQLALADCYEQGLGVPRDPSLAKEWRAKAKANNF